MKKWARIFVGAIVLLAIISGTLLTNYLLSVKSYKTAVSKITYEKQNILNIADGSYTGECDVQFIYAKVKVMVKDHRITDIELLEHRNGRGAAAESILENMIDTQKIDVDVVAGATNSSKVIKKAVDNALSSAP